MQRNRKIVTAGLVLASAAGGYVLSSMTQRAGAQTAIVNRGDGRGWCAMEVADDASRPARVVGFAVSGLFVYRMWSDGRTEAFDDRTPASFPTDPSSNAWQHWTGWRAVE